MKRCLLVAAIGAVALLLAAIAAPASALAVTTAGGAWRWQSPLPQGSGYSGAYFLDASHGWLISGGTIYHTTDGGLALTVQLRANVSFSAITFVDSRHGWAVGYPADPKGTGILFRTTNAGRTWARIRMRLRGGLTDVSFATTRVGWMTCRHAVLRTTDGGLHWTQRRFAAAIAPNAVQALGARRAWIAAVTTLLQTTNGGATWKRVGVDHLTHLAHVVFEGASDGWASGLASSGTEGQIAHTTDGGHTWHLQLNPGQAQGVPKGIAFADRRDGWTITSASVLHTTDGGADWVAETDAPLLSWVDAPTASAAIVGALAGVPGGPTGGLSRTTDGGATWQSSVSAADDYYGSFDAVQFIDDQRGWAVGGSEILATTDGGTTWTPQTSNTTEDLTGVHFADAQDGWAVGLQGTIVHTSDGGATWMPQTSGTSDDLTGVTFTDAQTGWATGQSFDSDGYSSGLILHTTDGGQDWTTQYDSSFDSSTLTPGVAFSAVAFVDPQDGWAVGETQGSDKSFNSSVIMHTTDGGTTWTQQLDYNSNAGGNTDDDTLSSVACTSTENAVAVGYDDNGAQIWHTANGGQTWTRVGQKLWRLYNSGSLTDAVLNSGDLTDVVFAGAKDGWAISDGSWEVKPFSNLPTRYLGSSIIHTTDGGATWTIQLVPSDADALPLEALSFVSPTRGWVVGDGGDILMTATGGSPPGS